MERRKMGDGRGGEGERKRGKEGILIKKWRKRRRRRERREGKRIFRGTE